MSMLTALARAQAVDRGPRRSRLPPSATCTSATGRWCWCRWRWPARPNAPLAAMVGDDPRAPAPAGGAAAAQPRPALRVRRRARRDRPAAYIEASRRTRRCRRRREPRTRYADAPQLLVPNPAGVAFIRLLGRSTRFRRHRRAVPGATRCRCWAGG